jgi:hypothetical protein
LHGLIHTGLQKFVEASYGAEGWKTLVARAGLEGEIFTPLGSYPDEHVAALVR